MKCLLVLCIVGLAATKNLNDERQTRLIGTPSTSTYQLEILYKDSKNVVKVCSGALIHGNWIITSAGCASKSTDLRVLLSTTTSPPVWNDGVRIKERIIHKSYVPKTMANDIALLKLYEPVAATVDILEIPDVKDKFLGEIGMVTGYGAEKAGGTSGVLREAIAGLQDTAFCKKEGVTISANQFCTYPTVACEGDQGSSFVIDLKLVGILSMTDSYATVCGNPVPSKFNYVAAYRTWIRTSTGLLL